MISETEKELLHSICQAWRTATQGRQNPGEVLKNLRFLELSVENNDKISAQSMEEFDNAVHHYMTVAPKQAAQASALLAKLAAMFIQS